MNILVPLQLETERLILRQFNDSDWRGLHRYFSDPVATRYTVNKKFSELETWYIVCSMIGHWQVRGYGPYVIEHREQNQVMGVAGFWYPWDWPGPEIKWALSREYWGNGYAREAAMAIRSAGTEYLPHISLVSVIHNENLASIKVAEAIGAVFEESRYFNDANWLVYRHGYVAER